MMLVLTQTALGLATGYSAVALAPSPAENRGRRVGTVNLDRSVERSSPPDATGSITFSAPNISAPFSDASLALIPGWTMSINVSAYPGQFDGTAGTSIFIEGPDSLQVSNGTMRADSSWYTCVWMAGPSNTGRGLNNGSFDGASCETALNKKWMSDWLSAITPRGFTGRNGTCPPTTLPDSCRSAFSDSEGDYEYAGVGLRPNIDFTSVGNWKSTKITYDDAVGRVWPVMIRWQSFRRTAGDEGGDATLQCVQAYDVRPGSELPSLGTRRRELPSPTSGLALTEALLAL